MNNNHPQNPEEAKKSGELSSSEASSADAGTAEQSLKTNPEKESSQKVEKPGRKTDAGKAGKSGKTVKRSRSGTKSSSSEEKELDKKVEVKVASGAEAKQVGNSPASLESVVEEVDASAVSVEKKEDGKVVSTPEEVSASSQKAAPKVSSDSESVKKKSLAKPLTQREVIFWYNLQFTFLGTYGKAGFLDAVKLEIRPKKKRLLQTFELVDNKLDIELEWGDATVQMLEGQLKAVAVGGGRMGFFGRVNWEKEGQHPDRNKLGFWTSIPFQLTSAD